MVIIVTALNECFVLMIHENTGIIWRYSWVSLGYLAVNLSGGQPKMYWWLCCTGVKKYHEIAHTCCQTQGQHIQWKTISLRWLRIDLEVTPSEIMMSRETQELLISNLYINSHFFADHLIRSSQIQCYNTL